MKKILEMKNKVIYVYLFFLTIAVVTVFVGFSKVDFANSKNYVDFYANWYSNGELADLTEVHQYESISKVLPKIEKDTQLYMNIKSINADIYIEDECIFKYEDYDKVLFGKTPGSYFVRVDLYREYSGKEIIIKFDNAYEDDHGKIIKMYLGDSADIVLAFVFDHLLGNLISTLIIFVGIISLVGFVIFKLNKNVKMNLLYLGLFAVLIGVFTFTDSKFLQVINNNAYFYHMISEISMLLIAVPLMQFIGHVYYTSCNKHIMRFLYVIGLLNFVVCYALHMSGILDYHQTIRITHSVYILCILYILYLCANSIVSKNKDELYHTFGLLGICFGTVIDIALIYISTMQETSLFTRLGVLVFLCLEGIQFMLESLESFKKQQRISMLNKLAYQDGLTELNNRTSFMDDMEELKDIDKGLIAVFDVNNLKVINDTFGHTSSDYLIIKVAELLKRYLSPLGKCYRIGGDEFVFITTEFCKEDFLNEYNKLIKYLDAYNKSGHKEYLIEVAMGYNVINNKVNIEKAFEKADKKMYDNKRKMKNK
ncbi:MAG: diguanylate cyclase [Bacilli bacterium]|nr:diguanylate cyclase [Bacilli bacterium]